MSPIGHQADMPWQFSDVRCWGLSGRDRQAGMSASQHQTDIDDVAADEGHRASVGQNDLRLTFEADLVNIDSSGLIDLATKAVSLTLKRGLRSFRLKPSALRFGGS